MKSRRSSILAFIAVVSIAACFVPSRTAAQTVSGRIVGVVKDPQGAVVANAAVSARNQGTGSERTATSDATGGYSIVGVPAGSYDLTVAAPGFQAEVRRGLSLTVGAVLRGDFTLTVGSISEKVEVTGEAPQVDTTTSTMSGLVAENVIRELPLNGRDWLQLAVLQPGVSNVLNTAAASNPRGVGLKMSISGGRPNSNVYRVDGLVVNDHTSNSPGSTLGGNMGVDAIREFSVLTNTYSAEYGRSSGGVINAITKSGTNTLHGTAFYFGRNSALDARNFFDTKLPPYRRNQFGASAGGPVKKDKLFFFGNYEGLRRFLSQSISADTLSPNARNGILTSGVVNIAPAVRPFLAVYPTANGIVSGDSAKYNVGAGQIGTENYVTGRIDAQLGANTMLSGSYTFDLANLGTPDQFNEKLQATRTKNQREMLTLQHSFTPTMLNTIRGGVNRLVARAAINYAPTLPLLSDTSVGFIPGKTFGLIVVPGLSRPGGMDATSSDSFWYTAPQLNDDLAIVKGRHNIRAGFSVEALRDNVRSPSNPAGQWTFGSIRDFLTGVPQQFTADFPGTDLDRGIRGKIFGLYVQDDFRLRSNLTLNLGVRYEPTTVVSEINGKAARLLNVTDAQPTIGNPLYENPTKRNFAPRVGLAWDPSGSGKTAIRSGFGFFDVPPLPNLFNLKLDRASPFFLAGNLVNPPVSSFPGGAFNLLTKSTLQNFLIERSPRPAYKMQWNLNVQRQLAEGLSATVGYVGARGIHLPVTYEDLDEVPPSLVTKTPDGHLLFPSARPIQRINPNFSQIRYLGWFGYSSYHSLQANLAQLLRHGFSFQVAYAWSKSIDIGSVEYSTSELVNSMDNPYSYLPQLQRGPSDFDVPHRVSVNFLWDAPSPHGGMALSRAVLSGWEISGIFTEQSGNPFNIRLPLDRAGTGSSIAGSSTGAGQRPDFKPGPGCSNPNAVNPGTPSRYIRVECFAFPAAGTLGNLGRGALRGPNLQNFDVSLFKNHNLMGEKLKMQFRAEFFNILNRANFGVLVATPFNAQGSIVPAQLALQPPTVTSSRQIQYGVKLIW